MKTYIVEIQSKTARITDTAEARSPFFAILKTVFNFHHLGANLFNTTVIDVK